MATRSRTSAYPGTLGALLLVLLVDTGWAAGGLVLQNEVCVLTIDFYESHFTAYQPNARGNEEFCHHLPGAGRTIIVLDYLHRSLKEVPVEVRIIRDVTGKGRFVREEDVAALGDVGPYTVFHQDPRIAESGTMTLELDFGEEGDYVGIVTAGHPTADSLHTAVFPIGVGTRGLPWGWIALGAAVLVGGGFAFALKRIGSQWRPDKAAGGASLAEWLPSVRFISPRDTPPAALTRRHCIGSASS